MLPETATIDLLDARIVRCIQLAPRAPFRVLAEVLDVSEQTVARRYRRLVGRGVLRVTAVVDGSALGQSTWSVRMRCRPSGADALADALARRDDVTWVTLLSGGTEVTCVLRARTDEARDELLVQRLPRSAPVLDLTATMLLHRFVAGGSPDDWSGLADVLDDERTRRVLERGDPPPSRRPTALEPGDPALLRLLGQDGRASVATLARATGAEESRVARRLRTLLDSGIAYIDVDLSVGALGFAATASLWMTVPPAALDAAGRALAAEPAVAYAAATTGPQNLTAAVVCRDVPALYRFVTERVGTIPGVQSLEIAPVLRHAKQAGVRMDGDRSARPATSRPAGR